MSKEPKRDYWYTIAEGKRCKSNRQKKHQVKKYWNRVRTWWKQFIQQQRRFDND